MGGGEISGGGARNPGEECEEFGRVGCEESRGRGAKNPGGLNHYTHAGMSDASCYLGWRVSTTSAMPAKEPHLFPYHGGVAGGKRQDSGFATCLGRSHTQFEMFMFSVGTFKRLCYYKAVVHVLAQCTIYRSIMKKVHELSP